MDTIIPTFSVSSQAYAIVFIISGRHLHLKKVRGKYQNSNNVFIPCLLRYFDSAGTDSDILYDWTATSIEGAKLFHSTSQQPLLVLDGHKSHIHYKTLKLSKDTRIVLSALKYTPNALKQVDLTVLGAYKCFFQNELHICPKSSTKANFFWSSSCRQCVC